MRLLIFFGLYSVGALAGQPLALQQTRYRLHAGERVPMEASQETLDFLRHAKTIGAGRGFAVGPSVSGGEVLLAASLTMKPGNYAVTLSATSEKGEERTATADITVDAFETVPSGSSVPPVVLLNGWQFSVFPPNGCPISSSSASTFGSLAQQLMLSSGNNVPVVYFFDNCVEQTVNGSAIEELGTTLGQFLDMIQYASGGLVPQIDLVGHSMGGLIARSYLAGLQANGSLSPPSDPRVRKFVEIATPNFGSFLAANFSAFIANGTQSAEMVPGSSFLWNLATWNQRSDDLRGVDALAIIGNAGLWEPSLLSLAVLANASDGVVSLTSASLGFTRDPSRTRIVPYCHIDSASSGGSFIGCSGKGIANVDEAPETGQIVLAFLAGNSAVWTSASLSTTPTQNTAYLAQYGGIYFGWENAADEYVTDLTQATFGTVTLLAGRNSGSLFYDEFAKSATGALQATSKSLGSTNCGSVTEPAGYYTAWRCKTSPSISSVTPLLAGAAGSVVLSGANITLNGVGFGSTQCATCQVSNAPGTILKVLTWSDQAITALLPTSAGLIDLTVQAASGSDSITFMAGSVSVTNAASSSPGPVAPGEIVAIKGSGLGPSTGVSFTVDPATGMVDTTLAGTRVFFGTVAAPILYTSSGQVNAVVPYEIAGQTEVAMQVQYQGVSLPETTVPVAAAAPGIFTFNATGTGPAAAVNQNGTLNGPSNPAVDGSYVTLYLTGGGQTNPAGVTGSISGSALKWLVQSVTATVGGQPATVTFDGAAPGFIDGFLQLNLIVPAGVHGTVPVIVTVGGIATPATATLVIE